MTLARKLVDIKARAEQAQRDAREMRLKDVKIEKITFELARLKAWKFGARTERMNAEQRQMFERTVAEDEADLAAQLAALQEQGDAHKGTSAPKAKGQPRRKPLPDDLRRVEHRHEPEDTTCGCGKPMVRVGEDVSERLDVIPAEFFVHRHIRGKWTCRCCETLVQEPVDPQIVDKGMPTAGLVAYTVIGHFVDHLPYYRLEQINARSGVVTPRSTLASGQERPAQRWYRCTTRIANSSSAPVCCTLTRRRSACSIPARARRAGPISGRMREAPWTSCRA